MRFSELMSECDCMLQFLPAYSSNHLSDLFNLKMLIIATEQKADIICVSDFKQYI